MQGLFLSLGLLASSAIGLVAAEDLKIDVTQAVECDRKTVSGDKISVHYRGSLQADGKEFDASYKRGRPFNVQIGAGQVISGWEQGLLDMCIGEKRTLTIPPELGYGHRAMGPIPAGSTLIFETELIAIDGVPAPEKIILINTDKAEETAEEGSSEEKKEGEEEAEGAAEKVAEKIASVAGEAAGAAKTIIADTDDTQEHNEL